MKIGVCSEKGKVRNLNEDYYTVYQISDDTHLFIVADGMGGHRAGNVASKMAVNGVLSYIKENFEEKKHDIPDLIIQGIMYSNRKVFEKSLKEEEYAGMGTTLTLGLVCGGILYGGHIGDSRIYLIRGDEIIQLSKDHSLVAELFRDGKLTQEEAETHPQKNIITRALGIEEEVKVDYFQEKLKDGDIIVLCTDGLTNLVKEWEIKEICTTEWENFANIPAKLAEMANQRGGYDNITVILVKYES